ncbi:3'-5' exonuclease domain-containing protein 2 [Pseudomonas stutzeri]|uniref:3'-5' exonuclease n=1 Tax=Stutzerimonas stutzeri TaxID=316 RepID=UPI0015E18E1D|nr:3'-5' exonuclease [Stutzerimonas stutzeri]MCQ4297319.1 3'-5' exonuclease domain-containing protein 2 [Stutzerimonas stutzeri]
MSQKPIIHIPQHPAIEQLPAFAGLARQRIVLPKTPEAFSAAVSEIVAASWIGFDTESKPTFKVGEVSHGPHLIQFATPDTGYLFQIGTPGCLHAVRAVLQTPEVIKIGFGLKSDRSRLHAKLDIHAASLLDLGSVLRYQGKKGQVGLRGAVAAILGARIDKSRRVATSNWANAVLTDAQQAYAANDAYAALLVFLGLSPEHQALLLQYAGTSGQEQRNRLSTGI